VYLKEVIKLQLKQQEIIVTLTTHYVPHPNPERGLDLLAKLVLKQILDEEAAAKREKGSK